MIFHRDLQQKIFEKYHHLNKTNSVAKSIGKSILPIAEIEVNSETIKRLADMPEIWHILPNQEVELMGPTMNMSAPITSQELKSGITWGLEELEIPKLWEKTKGKGVNVAVIDTGVDSRHFALTPIFARGNRHKGINAEFSKNAIVLII